MTEDNQQWDDNEYSDDTEYEYSDDEEYEDDGEEYEEELNEEYSDEDEEYEEDGDEEYSDEDEEYEDDGEEGEDEDDDTEYEEYEEEPKKNNSLIIILIIILLLLLLGGGLYMLFGRGGDQKVEQKSAVTNTQQTDESGFFVQDNQGENQDNTMDISFDENGNVNVADNNGENGDVIKVTDVPLAPAQEGVTASPASEEFVDKNLPGNAVTETPADPNTNDSIMVAYTKAANPNPFKPPVRTEVAGRSYDYTPYAVVDKNRYEIYEPPVTVVQDENLVRLLNTEISGIMYDATSPSAIIKLNNIDYYVKPGDKISGYTIGRITKDSVQVNYKNNSYVASVGELFSRETVNRHDVANVENKFGGRYKN